MKCWIVGISLVVLIGSSLACGQNASQAAGMKDLDRVVPRLPSGLSIEEVEERLGEPEARFDVEQGGAATVLIYRLWRVVFQPNLYIRIRGYLGGERHANDQPVASLDREVRALKLGSSKRTAERELGQTETWQIQTLGKKEWLWYGRGRWKLHFVDRRFAGKTLYD